MVIVKAIAKIRGVSIFPYDVRAIVQIEALGSYCAAEPGNAKR